MTIPSNPVHSLKVDKRIADPVHGLIRLTEIESQVLQHPIFQRLRDITQLGIAKYVYPGAMHNRFTHSLGVLHNATKIFDVAYRNWVRHPELSGDIKADYIFSEEILQATRLAAMCHDLGHFPFSHNLEQALDWMAEQNIIDTSFRHEQLSAVMIRQLLGSILGEYTDKVAGLIENDYSVLDNCLFPSFVVSSAIDADRMDYLIRDAQHCGVDQGRYDRERLLDSIIPYATKINGVDHDVLGFKSKGIEAVEQFLLARHRMHQTVYFNPSVVGYEAGLRRAYYRISTDDPPWELPSIYFDEPERFIEFNEAQFYTQLKRALSDSESWLLDPLVARKPLRKFGPFYFTMVHNEEPSNQDREKFSLLKEKQYQIEQPAQDWYQADHWAYVENKTQTLVDPLPRSMNTSDGFEDVTSLKNVVMLINAHGNLIDPTDAAYGHTFLPYITSNTYHRFLFFSHKRDTDRLQSELDQLLDIYQDFSTRPINPSPGNTNRFS